MPSRRPETQRDHGLRWKAIGLIALIVIVLSVPLHAIKERRSREARAFAGAATAKFVGTDACSGCHEEEYESWRGSDHDRAMAPAGDGTVLGDFGGASFVSGDISARLSTRAGRYYVRMENAHGEPTEFEIVYTIGFDPLQQYLVPFPDGRLQVLPLAWDTRRDRWFDPYARRGSEPDAPPGHWTGAGWTWNAECAQCHSTNVRKGYDPRSATYSTAWSEIDVACEACHGPGSRHVAWAEAPAMARAPTEDYELLITTSAIGATDELELCAPCHSHRVELGDYEHSRIGLLQHHAPSLLHERLYFADGQIRAQVYEYGSYSQSEMYRKGVRCGDCHDVHSLELVAEGNALCTRCHRASTYDTYEHHFHQQVHEGRPSDAGLCVTCHMPETTYMEVDGRADHSMLVPRPDLSLELGVPNACSSGGCHGDESVAWAAEHYRRWYGQAQDPHFGIALAEGHAQRQGAVIPLLEIAVDTMSPSIVRATALSLLEAVAAFDMEAYEDRVVEAFAAALKDADPLVRYASAAHVRAEPQTKLVRLLAPLLEDRLAVVRMVAARRLAGVPAGLLQDYQREALEAAIREFRDALGRSLDRPIAQFNLGNLHLSQRDSAGAEMHYRAAIELDDSSVPARVNLAIVLASRAQYDEAAALLEKVVANHPHQHEVAYSLGLILMDGGRYEEAVAHLRRAADHVTRSSHAHYSLGLAADATGDAEAAEAALHRALEIEPGNLEYLYALAQHYLDRGEPRRALDIADRMILLHPDRDAGYQLRMDLEMELQQASVASIRRLPLLHRGDRNR